MVTLFEFWHSHGCMDRHLKPHYWVEDALREERTNIDQWSAEYETDVAIDFLENTSRDRPFAVFLSWNPPHQPFDELPPNAPLEHYQAMTPEELLVRDNVDHDSEIGKEAAHIAPLYFAAVECIDAQLGRVMEALDSLELAENTIVVFTADHGMQLGSHDEMYKMTPWNESMRLPCLMRIPGVQGGESRAMMSSVDIAPTLIGLSGHIDAIPAEMQGRDLSPVILGQHAFDDDEVSLYYRWPLDEAASSARGLLTHRFKYVVTHEADGPCHSILLRREGDPYELNPLDDPGTEAALARRLIKELRAAEEDWDGLDWLNSRAEEQAA